jgi:hypothetical protein
MMLAMLKNIFDNIFNKIVLKYFLLKNHYGCTTSGRMQLLYPSTACDYIPPLFLTLSKVGSKGQKTIAA